MSYIDQASAVLSRGGGKTYSVKSSAFRSVSTMMTAPTNPSVRSSVIQSSNKGSYVKLKSTYSSTGANRQMLAPIKQDL